MADPSPADGASDERIRIDAVESVTIPWQEFDQRFTDEISRQRIGFECASGDWIERTWVGVPVLGVLDEAALPPETTHLRFESVDDVAACVPITALETGLVALGDSEDTHPDAVTDLELGGDYPRFVSPDITGPRAIKQLSRIEPLSLAPGTDPTEYESLPKRDSEE